ncbi:MAG TPA: hypothetical protein PKJ03_09020, partial [Methanoregulaceae archaeon]|nr:hypothetical protein [Methanoregulaceae archaeon]
MSCTGSKRKEVERAERKSTLEGRFKKSDEIVLSASGETHCVPLPLLPHPEPDRPVMNDVVVIGTRSRGRIEVGPVADDDRVGKVETIAGACARMVRS